MSYHQVVALIRRVGLFQAIDYNKMIVVYIVFIMLLVWLMVVKGNAGVNVFTAAALMLNDLEVNDNDPQRQ